MYYRPELQKSSGIILSQTAALPFLKFAVTFLFLQWLFFRLEFRFKYHRMCCCFRALQARKKCSHPIWYFRLKRDG